jgi:glyoxylase-like metal-dependent hydrolase (beta-lactamase superfamily II)
MGFTRPASQRGSNASPGGGTTVQVLAPELYLLRGFPPNAFNVYVMGDVIVDSGTPAAKRRVLKQVNSLMATQGLKISAHVLTHAHQDHFGSSKALCDELGIPLWCGEADGDAVEGGAQAWPEQLSTLARFLSRLPDPPAVPVARRLREGDEVGGFTVLHVPGHSAGHLAFWREADRVLVMGDVLFNEHALLHIPGLRQPPRASTPSPRDNRASARRLAALDPALICFGHGAPMRDTRKFADFVASLPN